MYDPFNEQVFRPRSWDIFERPQPSTPENPMSKSPIQPYEGRIMVRPIKPKEAKSAGGLVLPDSAKDREPHWATVLAVGPGPVLTSGPRAGDRLPVCLSVGDRVLVPKYSGAEITDEEGELVTFVTESEVLAVIRGDNL
jgi:chaperonin GroES